MPSSADEALHIAVTVSEAEIQEMRNNAFYLDSEVADISPASRIREPAGCHTDAKPAATNGDPQCKSSQAGQRRPDKRASTTNAQSGDTVLCYECSGYGHYTQDCVNRLQQRADSKAIADNGSKTGQGKTSEPLPRDTAKRVNGRRANKPPLNRVKMAIKTAPAIFHPKTLLTIGKLPWTI